MRDRTRWKPVVWIPILLTVLAFLGRPGGGYAAHDLSQDCYICHNIEGGQVWAGSYSFWSGKPIGMSPYSRPISCDICHTDTGDRFKSTAESHHPVAVINVNTMSSDYDNGVVLRCKDCHNADSVTSLVPNLVPDLAPLHYIDTSGNGANDGYPNHDVLVPNNQVVSGDPPHLLSMLLSAGQRTASGSSTYNRIPSADPATDYAFCLSCHDGSSNTSRQVNVRQDYIDKGHYFKTTGPGITAGDRIPCSDCHATHDSPTNARLFEPDNATFTGTRPTGLSYANPYAPTDLESRAICIFCHNDTAPSGGGYIAGPYVRGVEPSVAPSTISDHITYPGTQTTNQCTNCHNPHKTPGGGPDCFTCHTPGGAAGTAYDYIDSLFRGVGPDGVPKPADSPPLAWSQHGGFNGSTPYFLYTTPFDTKATNDCIKCHGDRHSNSYRLIDADTGGGDSYAYDPALGMQDNTTAGIANANAFCLTCHDGNGAAGDVQIGGQVPPNVATNWVTSGHGRPTSQTYTVSLNKGAELKCTACHEVHGSNHPKLLPADKAATGAFALPAAMPEKSFRSGPSTLLARDIDFTDSSSPASGKGFGTAGDPGDQRAPAGSSTGLCDACHRFAGRTNGGTDNVTNRAHTHEGITTDGNQDAASQMNFAKDCLECHDTHGTANIEMMKTTINSFAVTFTARTGANSFDPAESGATPNVNSVCVVCHQSVGENGTLNVDHNYRTSTVNPDHNEDANCSACHSHGNVDNAVKFGFPQAGCTGCHGGGLSGENFQNWWPDSQALHGTRWPNRNGGATPHTRHVNRIAEVVNATATPTTAQKNATCNWCHPTGRHTGDQAAPPADLMDGTTYVFKNIAGAANLRTTTVTQGPGTDNVWDNPGFPNDEVTCSTVDCHYSRDMGATDWYSPSPQSSTCSYCHAPDNTNYVAGDLPNAHDIHVGDYQFICGWCHPIWGGTFDHQDGQVSLGWGYSPGPEAGDRFVSGGTGVPKFGAGAAGDYATCGGLTCHGDWDDPGIAFKGGNNYSPNWFNTAVQVGTDNSDGRCGTCHGDPSAAGTDTAKGWPRSGVNSESHGEHISSNALPTCSACHFDPLGTNGTYGNPATHANRALTPIDMDNSYNYEAATAAFEGTGNTCANVRCHSGVTTPNFTLSGGTNITCGGCHNGGAGATDPRPSGDNVSRSHPAHADNNAVYTDCDNCHGNAAYNVSGSRGGSAYTATGGGGASPNGIHQNLMVNVYLNGGSGSYTDTDNTAGGVNWNSAGATHVDDGTCSSTGCHGAATPVWGATGSVACSTCHGSAGGETPEAPTVTTSSSHVDADGSGATWTNGDCKGCHAGHFYGVRIPLPPTSWSNANLSTVNMQTRLGIDYTTVDGIYLGGPGTSADISGKTTEAEICWGCHTNVGGANTYGVSEWGYNTKTTPSGYPVVYTGFPTQHDGTSQRVNLGWIYANSSYSWSQRTADWTAGYWMNEYDNVIRYRITSVHSASMDPAGQSSSVGSNVDGGGSVNRTSPTLESKSYIRCSYCHDVHSLGRNGYVPPGKPWVRGTWIGNPYPPELPPRSSYTYTTRINTLGPTTPRALSTSRDRGGYFIDQNSGWPTDNTGMNTLALTAGLCTLCHGTNVDTMDFYTGSTLWRAGMSNGHSNSTLGGTGTNKRDLFTGTRYGYGMALQANVPNTPWVCGAYGDQCDTNYPQSVYMAYSCDVDCNNLRNSGWFGGPVNTTTRGGGDYANWYGSGTIGAAKLPAGSMAHKFTCSKCHSPHATGMPALLTHNCIDPAQGSFTIYGRTGTNLMANNCHRKTSTVDGWHRLVPGQ